MLNLIPMVQKKANNEERLDTLHLNAQVSTVSWRAILSGILITLLAYLALTSLGMGIGGAAIQRAVQNQGSPPTFQAFSAVWIILSALISLFLGSYACGRVSGLVSSRVGAIQGLVITSLFFIIMISGMGSPLGEFGQLGIEVGPEPWGLGEEPPFDPEDIQSTAELARSVSYTGWILFGSMAFGSLFSALGGALGVRRSLRAPISTKDQNLIRESRAA